jgi:hypothetical protein
MKTKPLSPVIQSLSVIWNNTMKSGKSYNRLNAALQGGLSIAIGYGFVFERSDFIEIENRFQPFYWMGLTKSGLGEYYYSAAVKGPGFSSGRQVANLSAAKAFEHWKGRKPYIVKGRRLALGSEVRHPEHGRLWVTSIDPDKIGMCWYDNPGNHNTGKPKRHFVFTHETIKSEGLK